MAGVVGMSIKVLADVMRDPRYDGKQKLILVAIANAVNNQGVGFASHQQIQQVTDVTSRYIRDCVAGFVADGRLEIVRKGVGRGNATVYRVLPRADADTAKRGTTEQGIGELDAPFYDVDEALKGELRDTKRGTGEHLKGELENAKRGTGEHLKGELGGPKRGTPPSSPPSFTSLEDTSPETSALTFTSLSLVPAPSEIPATEKTRDKDSPRERAKSEDTDGFEAFWSAYPRKVGKGKARDAYGKALALSDALSLIEQARRFAAFCQGKDEQFIPYPSTWLNQERWADEISEPVKLREGWYMRPDGIRVDPVGRLVDPQGMIL